MTQKKQQQGACPYCGSTSITYEALEVAGDSVFYPCECDVCGRSFYEWYELVFTEQVTDEE